MWGWARQANPVSRVVAVQRTPEGGDCVVLSLRGCEGRPDGQYALRIPPGWRDLPTRRSRWGSEVREIAEEATVLEPATAPVQDGDPKVRQLKFNAVARGWRPFYGGDFGVIYVRDQGRFSAEVFGYVDGRGEWVRLAGVELDPGRPSRARTALALVGTPFTAFADVFVGMGYLRVAAEDGVDNTWPRYMSYLPRYAESLSDPRPWRRRHAAERLKKYGAHAKSTVPALRRSFENRDEIVRPVAVTLRKLCPKDSDFYVPPVIDTLRSGTTPGRSEAASLLGDWRTAEAVPDLATAVGDEEHAVRRESAGALGRIGPASWRATPALRGALEDESLQVRRAAKKALKLIESRVTDVELSDAFFERRPDGETPVAVLPVSNETADMDYPPLVRGRLAPGLGRLGYSTMPLEDCDVKLRAAGITQGGQLAFIEARTVGDVLGSDYAVYGHISTAATVPRLNGLFKVLVATFRLKNTRTGELLWRATGHGEVRVPCSVKTCIAWAVANALATLPGPSGAAADVSPGEPPPAEPVLDPAALAVRYKELLVECRSDPARSLEILEDALPEFLDTKYEPMIRRMIERERSRQEQ